MPLPSGGAQLSNTPAAGPPWTATTGNFYYATPTDGAFAATASQFDDFVRSRTSGQILRDANCTQSS